MSASQKSRLFRTLILLLWSVVLTGLTFFLGAAPLRVMKELTGRWAYWLINAGLIIFLLATPFQPLAIVYLALVVLVGIFVDLDQRGHSLISSGTCAVSVTALLIFGSCALWIYHIGAKWKDLVLAQIDQVVLPARQLVGVQIETNTILNQIPSGILVLLIFSIFSAVLFQERLRALMALPAKTSISLCWFSVPESYIWVLTACLFFSFSSFGAKLPAFQMVAVNGLNVILVLYFFQGLAVVMRAFEVLRVTGYWKFVLLVIIVMQLFLCISVLGIIDYWANFRERINRKATDWQNKENI